MEHIDEITKRYMRNLCKEIVRVIRVSDMLEDDGFNSEEISIIKRYCDYQDAKEEVENLKIKFACMKGLLSEKQAAEFFNYKPNFNS